MARLKVFLDGQLSSQHELNPSQDFVAGRGESCDCVLRPERGISRQHFKIFQTEMGWEIESLSRFGELYINGEKIERTLLSPGQMFSVPPYEFVFEEGPAQNEVSVPSIRPPELSSRTNTQGGGITNSSDERTQIGAMPSAAILRLIDNRGNLVQTFGLQGFNWVAGRDVGCTIFIDNAKISRKQFEIQKTEETYFVRDLGGTNGTLVNGRHIPNDQWTQLQSSDVITVADWSLVFEIRDAEFEQRLAAVDPAFRSPVAFTGGGGQGGGGYSPVPYSDPMSMPAMYLPPGPNAPGNAAAGGMMLFGRHFPGLNPVRLALIVIILLGVGYFVNEELNPPEAPKQAKVQSPFDALPVEKQQIVKQTYSLATEYYMTGRFSQALQKLQELHSIIPAYEDSQQLMNYVQTAMEIKENQEKLRAQEEDEKRLRAMVKEVMDKCKAMVEKERATITMDRLEACVQGALEHDPNNGEVEVLRQQVDALVQDRAIKAAQSAEQQAKIKAMEALYKRAVATEKRKRPLTAIGEYAKVVAAPLPDPNGRKRQAQRRIASIEKDVRNRQGALIKAAEAEYAKGNRKGAIQMLKKSIRVNPGNNRVDERITEIIAELRKDMQPIYHEGILEESVGNVDTARQKFTKILEISIAGEEYYDKAKMKMRKYGQP